MHDPLGIRGTLVGDKYRVGNAVALGGFSVVYRAEHALWQRPVAIKFFRGLAGSSPEQRDALLADFVQEGKLMAALSSRTAAIVQAHDIGTFTAPGGLTMPYLILEWLEGYSLTRVLQRERDAGLAPRTLEQSMALLEQVAVALALAHADGVVHRDIKPDNLLVIGDARSVEARVKVLDFGIAKVMSAHVARTRLLDHTGKEITAFTPNYGAPEQFSRSHGATGPWTDVFAMALILIEMMRGGRPTLGGPDYMRFSQESRDEAIRPTPRRFGLPVSPEVEAVFARAVAVSPRDRFADMGELWAALHAAVAPSGPPWTGAPRAPRAPERDEPSSLGVSSGALPAPRRSAPGLRAQPVAARPGTALPTGVLAAIAAAAVLGIVVGYLLVRQLRAPLDPPAASGAALTGQPPASAVVSGPVPPATATPSRPAGCVPEMALIGGGAFVMGSDEEAFGPSRPAHRVTLDSFCIDRTEVTVAAFTACVRAGDCPQPDRVPSYPKSPQITAERHEQNRSAYGELCTYGRPGHEQHPVNCVPWSAAQTFCKTQQKRLPTEAEWELAARGSEGRRFAWGDAPPDVTRLNACGEECNRWEKQRALPESARMFEADDGFAGTAPVGSFPAGRTPAGVHDLGGNVWEWTADWFEAYRPDDAVNPIGAPAGERKVIRGGAFNGGAALWLSPVFRFQQLASASSHGIGFRCVTSL